MTTPHASRKHNRPLAALLAILLAGALAGCGGSSSDLPASTTSGSAYANRIVDQQPGTLLIAGDYLDEWGTNQQIRADLWQQDYGAGTPDSFHVLSYDDTGEFVVAQNDAANAYNPGLYSRFDWSLYNGDLYYCQTEYAASTGADAAADTSADRTDPTSGGCAGFAWTQLGAPYWPFYFQPQSILGTPGGGQACYALRTTHIAGYDPVQGYDPTATAALGGSITVGLADPADAGAPGCAVDGSGADLVVYENAFRTGDIDGDPSTSDPGTNSEVATVEVSQDTVTWYLFPPAEDAAKSLLDPARYTNLAGVMPADEGGDRFDLASIAGLPAGFQACYVRLTDGGTVWADYGNTQTDVVRSGADIDAVEALHAVAAPGLMP